MDLHLEVEGCDNWLMLPLENGTEKDVAGRLVEIRHLDLDGLWVKLGCPE